MARRSHVVKLSATGGVAGGAKWSQLAVEAVRGRSRAAAVDGGGAGGPGRAEAPPAVAEQSRGAGGRSRGAARRALVVVEPECDQSQQRHCRQSQWRRTAGAGWTTPAIERLQC